ncbi:MAG: MFS transporter [Coprobacter sp.]|nr:MFS transporter [Barnesiella sp. GGCC_0306]MBS7039422.1 MFS transporter [Bacteroidales bacterium]PWM90526.1 MAG: MFS transporter [Coprobacter sp.]
MKRSNFPFHDWVPRWLGISILFFMFLPSLFISGAYTVNSGEMSSGLGILSEHIQFSSFCTSIGMVVYAPFMVSFLKIGRPKMVFLAGCIILFFLSWLCAVTESMPLLMLCSFFMGFIRMILVFNTLFTLIHYATGIDAIAGIENEPDLSPEEYQKGEAAKGIYLPFMYLFFMIVAQIGNAITAWCAYEYQWQYSYYFMMGLLLVALILTEVTMKYQKRLSPAKITFSKFADMTTAAIAMLGLCYILIYGKTLDWFDNPNIRLAAYISLVSLGIFLLLQANSQKGYIKLEIFSVRKGLIACLMFMFIMILNSSSILVNAFTGVAMKIDNFQSANLGNYTIIGYIAGAVTAAVMAWKKIHYKYIFSVGFLYIIISALFLYFWIQPQGLYEYMKWPTLIRAAGMIIVYAMSAIYGQYMLPKRLMVSWVFLMLAFRSVIAPVAGVAVYSNLMNERQQYYITKFVSRADATNTEVADLFRQTQAGSMIAQGKSYEEGSNLAAISLRGRIQVQGLLATLKEIAGWTIWGGILFIIITLIIPYDDKKEKLILETWARNKG